MSLKNKEILTVQPDISALTYHGIALGLLFLRLKAVHEWIKKNPGHNHCPSTLEYAIRDLSVVTKGQNGNIERHAENAYAALYQFSNEAAPEKSVDRILEYIDTQSEKL
jgi:hypothetical protein